MASPFYAQGALRYCAAYWDFMFHGASMYQNLDEAMAGLSVWKQHRRNKVSPLSKNVAYKPTFEADYYREIVFHRLIELIESAHHLYRSDLLIGSIVVARAAQETLSIMWFLNLKLQKLADTKDIARFTKTMQQLILGWCEDPEFPEKVNVLTCIDAVDKRLGGKFRRHYDMLSEYSHPNYSGTMGAFGKPNHASLEVEIGLYPRSKEMLKSHLQSTLIICIQLLDTIQQDYEVQINRALDACHELHAAGKLIESL
jgi:hypothetical protein